MQHHERRLAGLDTLPQERDRTFQKFMLPGIQKRLMPEVVVLHPADEGTPKRPGVNRFSVQSPNPGPQSYD